MTKFSGSKRRPLRINLMAPIRTGRTRTLTHEGGAAYTRDVESDLFLLAATNMVGEDTFYEHAERARRALRRARAREVTATNPAFRRGPGRVSAGTMLMRSATIVMAAEYVAAGGRKRPRRTGAAASSGPGQAGRDARLLAHGAWSQPADAGQPRCRRRRAAPVHGARRAALRRPVRVRSAWPT